jgi:hypothetical protein
VTSKASNKICKICFEDEGTRAAMRDNDLITSFANETSESVI